MNKILEEDFKNIINSEAYLDKFNKCSILITGATGLIGSVMTKFFIYLNETYDYDIQIYALIRDTKKAKRVFGTKNIKMLHFIKGNLIDKSPLNIHNKIDYIIHTAAITDSKTLISKPVQAIEVSLNGTEKLLKIAVDKKIKSMVYISSMEVYGQPHLDRKIVESDQGFIDLTNPRSCYPESKRMCECMCTAYASQFNVNVKIARLAQTFGAGVLPEDERVFAQFTKSIMNGQNLILHTEGKSEGNYVYTADAIKAILLLLIKGEKGEAYNVVNENSHTTIKNMAKMIIKEFGDKTQKVIIKLPNKNLGYAPEVHMNLSGEKLRMLNWIPKVGLIDSYRRLIKYNELESKKSHECKK
ncbi:NAD(P)-dependent oxidoreductase [Limosilactobacillus reuteri]|uniref:NAD-dependent epimerase/dehydratase family protein n=1 Tax=Limosilactobacillus reuteri TaxID=1598 RepID=UPI001181376F|nr:NAD(P)-dependent oxidoreductase [Limosilactobacillus reuteri]MCT3203232.1 NAD(P)-dependent oxidoreductase [Limosilactobacillus reuteri]MCT3211831.1 NAD(P)-dependent oxidoreductase [Limosilactobacillus reuteri]TSB18831.1 NAD(P)-dependent oxidoreductase [Limosilactobacillus reuteri]UAW61707.1 NAD(P)-dependent oxidoreductase [Limosilactobacillus reuteri]